MLKKCALCRKTILLNGVVVVIGRPNDTAQSLMLMGQEKLAIQTLQRLGVENVSLRSDIAVCKECWTDKLEPDQIAIIDEKLNLIISGKGKERPSDSFIPLGNLTGEYYVSKLACIVELSKERDVLGWALFAAANGIQNFSREIDSIAKRTLLPKVEPLTRHSDRDISMAASYVLQAFSGNLPYGTWRSLGAKSWNDFKK